MKKLLHFLILSMLFISCQTAKKTVFNQMVNTENTYFYSIDLVNVEKDKVSVTLLTPKSNLEKGRFVIPKLVPGYYSKEGKHFAKTLADSLKNLLKNQQAYLGGQLPVKDYAFLIYHEIAPQGNLLGDGLE